MINEVSVADLRVVQADNVPLGERARAVLRLSENNDEDIREIAAQISVEYPMLDCHSIVEWIEREKTMGVRNYLYLALAIGHGPKAQDLLLSRQGRVNAQEQVYVLGALAIAFSSRMYQAMILPLIFSEDCLIADSAATVARMITDADDEYTLRYIDILERDSARVRSID